MTELNEIIDEKSLNIVLERVKSHLSTYREIENPMRVLAKNRIMLLLSNLKNVSRNIQERHSVLMAAIKFELEELKADHSFFLWKKPWKSRLQRILEEILDYELIDVNNEDKLKYIKVRNEYDYRAKMMPNYLACKSLNEWPSGTFRNF